MKSINANRLVLGFILFMLVFSSIGTNIPAESYDVIEEFEPQAWYNPNWHNKKKITIDHNQIDEDLKWYPVLINITDADLASYAQNDGDDILFTDSTESNKLNHEIELFNGVSGKLTAWVNVTDVSSSTNTEIYMYFNNPGSANQEDASGTWANGYDAVWHFDGLTDSTGNGHTLTNAGATEGYGHIGYAYDFEQDNTDYMNVSGYTGDPGTDNTYFYYVTVESTHTWRQIVAVTPDVNGDTFKFGMATGNIWRLFHDDGSNELIANGGTPSTGRKIFHTILDESLQDNYIYLDTQQIASDSSGSWNGWEPASKIFIGAQENTAGRTVNKEYHWDGLIDEIRISNCVRNASWRVANYNAVNNASDGGFISVGGLDSTGITAPIVTTENPIDVSYDRATLVGNLTDDGGQDCDVWIEWGKTIAYGNTENYSDDTYWVDEEDEYYQGGDAFNYDNPVGAVHDENWSDSNFGGYQAYDGNDKDGYFLENYTLPTNADNIKIYFKYKLRKDTVAGSPSDKGYIYISYYNWSSGSYQEVFTDVGTEYNPDWELANISIPNTAVNATSGEIVIKTRMQAFGPIINWPKIYAYFCEGNISYTSSSVSSPYEFNFTITGLEPETIYHYKAFANNSNATTNGTDIQFKTSSPIYDSPNITNIEETTTTLSSEVLYDTGEAVTCGFWIGNVSVNASNYERNVTCSGTYTSGQTFSKEVTSLTSGEYYYVRSWIYNSSRFFNSTNESYFLTKPEAPTELNINESSGTAITLRWKNASVGVGTNQTTLIRYSTSSPGGSPDPASWGILGYNGSGNWTEISGLSQDTTYHFALWTYINASGSPLLWHYSDGYVTAFNSTGGGSYNISVRYENESNGRNALVNLSRFGPHDFRIHYSDEVDYVIFNNGVHTSTTPGGDFSTNASGYFNITTDKTIQFIEFTWNASDEELYTCKRILIPESGERNLIFYIRTDMPVYGETYTRTSHVDYHSVTNPAIPVNVTTSNTLDEIISVYIYNKSIYGGWISVANDNYSVYGNRVQIDSAVLDDNTTNARVDYYTYETIAGIDVLEGSLIRYTYSFIDDTSLYTTENGAYHEIYCYNSSGEKLVIDEQFFDTSLKTYPWLIYQKKYYIGVHCTEDDRSRLGFAPTSDETNPEILIPYDAIKQMYNFFDLIDVSIGWYATGFYVDYLDTTGSTVWANFSVYGYANKTNIYYENISGISNYNFTFACNISKSFFWDLYVEIDSSNDVYDGIYKVSDASMIPGMEPITNVKRISDIFNNTIGLSPFYDVDDTSRYVPWAYLIIFGIAFMVLTTTAKANATLGTLATGLVLIFAGGAVTGMQELYTFIPDAVNTPFIIAIGIFLVVIAIIASMGGEDNR